MPELAARPRRLSIVVPMKARFREQRLTRRELAYKVEHGRMPPGLGAAQREAGDGSHVVLELARIRAFDGPVTRIVHPRRHLVGDELAAADEEFDRENAHVFEMLEQLAGGSPRLARERGIAV